MEGTVIRAAAERAQHPQEFLQVDTSNILFVYDGAFAGLDKVINAWPRHDDRLWRGCERPDRARRWRCVQGLETEDLVRYGLIPEVLPLTDYRNTGRSG